MDIARLRLETAEDHRAAEETLPLMSEDLRRDEYITSLIGIYGIVAAWERYAATHAPLWLQSVVAKRNRKHMLEQDLTWFKVASPIDTPPAFAWITSDADLLGAMYVMEGSTLGGQLIARSVTRVLGLTGGHGDTFFRGHGDRTGPMWKEFCEVLRSDVPDTAADAVIISAKAMFQGFGSWMRRAHDEGRGQNEQLRHTEACAAP